MEADLDQFYTPAPVAQRLIAAITPPGSPFRCVDPTCGLGSLLAACEDVFRRVECFGLDRNRDVIRALRRNRPHWTLSVGNFLCDRSLGSTRMLRDLGRVDLLALNPPFSQSGRKFVEVIFDGECIRASIAMAYMLRSLRLFNPRHGAVAVVPESLLYSDVDSIARSKLGRCHTLTPLFELQSSTFGGTRARTVAVRICRQRSIHSSEPALRPRTKLELQLVRGSLPVHMANFASAGIPFIHSTDIGYLAVARRVLRRVSGSNLGVIRGWQLLLPRVGLPKQEYMVPTFIRNNSTLSDCMIALGAADSDSIGKVAKVIVDDWERFVGLYRGTGARFVTVTRLHDWLESKGIAIRS